MQVHHTVNNQNFHQFEFETSLLVCHGASSNLSTIKQTLGVSGVFGGDPSQADPNAIAYSFANPFNPAKRIYWLICPSQQLRTRRLFSTVKEATSSESTESTSSDRAYMPEQPSLNLLKSFAHCFLESIQNVAVQLLHHWGLPTQKEHVPLLRQQISVRMFQIWKWIALRQPMVSNTSSPHSKVQLESFQVTASLLTS